MRKNLHLITLLLVFAVVLSVASLCAAQEGDRKLPSVVIGPVVSGLKLDGKLDDPAWNQAAEITGFLRVKEKDYASHQPLVLLAYDDDNLYVGVQSPLSSGERLRSAATKKDEAVLQDDRIELYLDPTPGTTDYFHIAVNSKGVLFDRKGDSARAASNQDAAWNLIGSPVEASVGPKDWTVEMAIPFKGLGLKGISDRDQWLFNICETRQGVGDVSLCAVEQCGERNRFGSLIFRKDQPRVRIAQIGNIGTGQTSIVASYAGLSNAPVELVINGRQFDDTANTWFALFSKSSALTQETREVFRSGEAELKKSGRLELQVRAGAERIYAAEFDYEVLSGIDIETMRVIREKGKRLLRVRTVQPYDGKGQDQNVKVSIVAADGNRVAAATQRVLEQKMDVNVDIASVPPGTYRVAVELIGKEGAVRKMAHSPEFVVYPEPPPWRGNKLGVSNSPPPPWTPLVAKREGDQIVVRCWNREYRFGDKSLLPEQIVSGGADYLQGPIALMLGVNGPESDQVGAKHRLVNASGRECVITSAVKVPWGELMATTTVEFDGFIWVDLTLRPQNPVKVEQLAVEWKMPPARSRLLHSGNRSMVGVGRTPKVWNKRLDQLLGPFWVGDENGGISFAVESFEGWSNANVNRQAEVFRDESRAKVRINIIDRPRLVRSESKYGFCLHPTPVRPRPAMYRGIRAMNWMGKLRGGVDYPVNFSQWNATNKYFGSPMWCTTPEELKWYCEVNNQNYDPAWFSYRGMQAPAVRSTWYVGCRSTGMNSPAFIWRGEAWKTGEKDELYGGKPRGFYEDLISVCKTEDFTDYFLWELDKSKRENKTIDGLYFDLMGWEGCAREDHGHGYIDEKGRRHPTWPLRDQRRWFLRIYTYLKERDPQTPVLLHLSGQAPKIMGYSFCDYHLTGELWIKEVQRDLSYKDMPLETFRAEGLSQPWGPGKVWLSQLKRALTFLSPAERKRRALEPSAYRQLMGLLLVHDNPILGAGLEKLEEVWKALDRSGLTERDRFIPYWEGAGGVDLSPKDRDIVASAYANQKSALVVVFNNTDADRDTTVKIDTAGLLGRKEAVRVSDAETQKEVASSDQFSVSIPKRDFRLLVVRPR
jgi:hypothetical protein